MENKKMEQHPEDLIDIIFDDGFTDPGIEGIVYLDKYLAWTE